MKKIYLLTALAAGLTAVPARAQDEVTEENDSIKVTDLAEFVVEGRTQRVIKYGVEYTPDKKVKKLAMDATHLLSMMQIPQLITSPGSTKVTNFFGQDYSLFIDFIPASESDISALRPQDVLRVEVLDYPQDPRFNSAQRVVNFIMVKYEWGGYTKLEVGGFLPNNRSVSGAGYSKFVTGKWTLDANAGGRGRWYDRDDSWSRSTFRDIWYDGTRYPEVIRESASGRDYKSRANSEWASFRAAYQKENIYISHNVGFNRQGSPLSRNNGDVTFSPEIINSSSSLNESSSQTISPSINAYYQFSLPKGNSIVAYWSFNYGHTKSHSLYELLGQNPILKDNREEVYVPNANISYSKNLGHNNTFRTALMTYNSIYDTHYAGSYVDRQKMLSSENMLFLEYMQNWGFGLSLYSRVGASYVIGRLNGVNTLEQWNPRLGFQLQYRANQCHSMTLEGWWGNSHPSPSTTNDALIQTNELEWSMGNPDLRNTLFQMVQASYNFIPTNQFSLTAALKYEGNPHRQALEYFVLPDHDGLVHRIVNSGSAHQYEGYVSASLRLLGNSLMLKATGYAQRYVLTGLDAVSVNNFGATASVQYVRDHWSINLFYNPPAKGSDAWSKGWVTYVPQSYGLYASCAFGDFRASVSFANWFRTDGYNTSVFNSPLFSCKSVGRTSNLSRGISLSMSYTFSYGKKVNRNDELREASGVGSAILQ